MLRPTRDKIATILGLLSAVAIVLSCSRAQAPINESVSLPASASERLLTLSTMLPCDDFLEFDGDMYFYDEMHGRVCLPLEGEVYIRVYEKSSSVPNVLQDWGPNITGGRELLYGSNWFIVGPAILLSNLSPIEGARGPTQQLPAPVPLPAGAESMNDCVRFASGAIVSAVTDPTGYATDIETLNLLYPGLSDVIDSDRGTLDWRTVAEAASDSTEFEAALSKFSPSVHQFCDRQHALHG